MPKVSILTPTFNHEEFIAQCIESVLNQTYSDWEMIVIDDGSTDKTSVIAQDYASRDHRIKFFTQVNRGPQRLAETYNFALDNSSGGLIAILEGDDKWVSEKLAWQVPVHTEKVIMSYGQFSFLTDRDTKIGPVPPFKGSINTVEFLRFLLLGKSQMLAVTQMISRSALERIGGFSQDNSPCAVDMATLLKLSQLEGQVHYIHSILGFWRQHPGQATNVKGVELAEFNLALALNTFNELDRPIKDKLGILPEDILKARRSQLSDVYFALTRSFLVKKDKTKAFNYAVQLWNYGGALRKLEAIYACAAAPIGLTFEPILKTVESFMRLSKKNNV